MTPRQEILQELRMLVDLRDSIQDKPSHTPYVGHKQDALDNLGMAIALCSKDLVDILKAEYNIEDLDTKVLFSDCAIASDGPQIR